ncbi:MAG TPA: hypothetical protein VK586_28150 [Streptosporangiaceae bacterium]|nr:hypothetical protein [Streptosporangiaceae bacterium]
MSIPRYEWRARVYPMAQRAIGIAEAEHGPPVPTCPCGLPLPEVRSRNPHARCETCRPGPLPGGPASVLHFLNLEDEPACHVAGEYEAITDPRKVTCRACLRTTAIAVELAARMVTA